MSDSLAELQSVTGGPGEVSLKDDLSGDRCGSLSDDQAEVLVAAGYSPGAGDSAQLRGGELEAPIRSEHKDLLLVRYGRPPGSEQLFLD